jgi:hypothetical protein
MAHPASYSARTAGIFPGVKRSEREDGPLPPSMLRTSTTVPTPICIHGCFIATSSQLCFRICHWENSSKLGGTENKWEHQLLIYADYVNLLAESKNAAQKTHISVITY